MSYVSEKCIWAMVKQRKGRAQNIPAYGLEKLFKVKQSKASSQIYLTHYIQNLHFHSFLVHHPTASVGHLCIDTESQWLQGWRGQFKFSFLRNGHCLTLFIVIFTDEALGHKTHTQRWRHRRAALKQMHASISTERDSLPQLSVGPSGKINPDQVCSSSSGWNGEKLNK